jgi:hypothetical protein
MDWTARFTAGLLLLLCVYGVASAQQAPLWLNDIPLAAEVQASGEFPALMREVVRDYATKLPDITRWQWQERGPDGAPRTRLWSEAVERLGARCAAEEKECEGISRAQLAAVMQPLVDSVGEVTNVAAAAWSLAADHYGRLRTDAFALCGLSKHYNVAALQPARFSWRLGDEDAALAWPRLLAEQSGAGTECRWRHEQWRVDIARSAATVEPLGRLATGQRLRIQSEMAKDLLDYRPLEDGRDDLQLPITAVRAVLHVDVKAKLQRRLTCTQVTSQLKTRLSSRAQLMRCGRTWTVSTSQSAASAASVAGLS